MNYYEYKKMKDELADLKENKRKEIMVRQARLKKNNNKSEKRKLKLEERQTEARICELERLLARLERMEELQTVFLGCRVMLLDKEYGEKVVFSIVRSKDADSLKNKISDQSPIGRKLLGKKAGDVITVDDDPDHGFKIISIEGIEPGYEPKDPPVTTQSNETEEVAKEKDKITKEFSFKDFLTKVHVFHCTAGGHKLKDIRCRVRVMAKSGQISVYTIPGAYCETCDKYYILEDDYKRLKQKGVLICKVVEKEYWISPKKQNLNLNEESLLHMMDYNVNAQTGLTKKQRWGILEMIVDEEVLTVTEIRSHLNWLIRRNRNNHNFDLARSKWQEDSNHLAEYKTGDVVNVQGIKINVYKGRDNI